MAVLGPVTVTDMHVAEVWRPMTDAEKTIANRLLERAAAMLPAQSPGLLDRLTAGTTPVEAVEQVLIDAVLRILRNPEGWKKGTRSVVGEYTESWEWDEAAAARTLHFTDDELRNVAGPAPRRRRAYTINTTPRY